MKVAIFPGHVGKDSGAVVTRSPHTIEAVITLSVATILNNLLRLSKIDSQLFTGNLSNRTNQSNNWGANLGISLHCDWFHQKLVKGIHQLVYDKYGKSGSIANNIDICIKENFANDDSLYPRLISIKENKKLWILKKTAFPTTLIEMGFLTNCDNRVELNDENYRIKIANSIHQAILLYIH